MTSPPPPQHPAPSPSPSLWQTAGLQAPRPAPWRWPPDAAWALALLAAVPVWALLGALVGTAMRVPVGWWAWLSLVAVQPLLEELVFRGVLQGLALETLTRHGRPLRWGPLTLANALVSLGFVLLHLRAQPLAWALAVLGPSLLLGWLRERYASVWPSVLVHAVYNAGFGLTAWWVAAR